GRAARVSGRLQRARLGERGHQRRSRLVADAARGVALPFRVLHEDDRARRKFALFAVRDLDRERAAQADDEERERGGVRYRARLLDHLAEVDALDREGLRDRSDQVGLGRAGGLAGGLGVLEVRLAVTVAEDARVAHQYERGMSSTCWPM